MPFGSWWMKQNTHLFAQVAMSPGRGAASSRPRSDPRRRSRFTAVTPSRSTASSSRSSPAWNWKSIASRSGWPLTATMRSPRARPAAAAGVRAVTAATVTPVTGSPRARPPCGFALPLGSAEQGVFRRVLPLHSGGGVEKPHALDDVLQARDDREPRREPEHGPGRQLELEEARQQAGEDGEDLEEGRRLPRPRRARTDAAAQHVDQQRAHHQDDVAADHEGRDPERQGLEVGQRDERRGEQELVRRRIEKRAERALV